MTNYQTPGFRALRSLIEGGHFVMNSMGYISAVRPPTRKELPSYVGDIVRAARSAEGVQKNYGIVTGTHPDEIAFKLDHHEVESFAKTFRPGTAIAPGR